MWLQRDIPMKGFEPEPARGNIPAAITHSDIPGKVVANRRALIQCDVAFAWIVIAVATEMDEIDLELGAEDEQSAFDTQALVQLHQQQQAHIERSLHGVGSSALSIQEATQQEQHDKQIYIKDQQQQQQQQTPPKKKVVKKWRDEWADTYKWAYVALHEGSSRIFCKVCKEFGRKHRRNPYGNEGSRNMQMSALEEHNNSLLHKEALRLQAASRDKGQHCLSDQFTSKICPCVGKHARARVHYHFQNSLDG